jgi:hypothetical protein
MSGTCSTHRRNQNCIENALQNKQGSYQFVNLAVDARIILKLKNIMLLVAKSCKSTDSSENGITSVFRVEE